MSKSKTFSFRLSRDDPHNPLESRAFEIVDKWQKSGGNYFRRAVAEAIVATDGTTDGDVIESVASQFLRVVDEQNKVTEGLFSLLEEARSIIRDLQSRGMSISYDAASTPPPDKTVLEFDPEFISNALKLRSTGAGTRRDSSPDDEE